MKSAHEDEAGKKVKVTHGKKRFSLTADYKQNTVLEEKTLSPTKVCPSTKKSSVPPKLSIMQYQVRRSVLRQFDPLLKLCEDKEDNQIMNMVPASFKESGFHEKELMKELAGDLSCKATQLEENILANTKAVDSPVTAEQGPLALPPSAEWSCLSTIVETSTEDLIDISSTLNTPGTLIEAYVKVSPNTSPLEMYSADLIRKVPSDLYGQLSHAVADTSSCSSCSSYTTSCSTLEDFFYAPPILAPYDEDPLRAQQYLHQEFTLENELCIQKLKMVHESNKAVKIIKETYEKHLQQKILELSNAHESHEEMKMLMTMGEDAFSNLHSKYNKAKEVIHGLHKNEREIKKICSENEDNYKKCKEKCQLLNEHGKIKLMEFRDVALQEPKTFEKELKMMQANVKHLQIKVSSLQQQLADRKSVV